jgi:hypothetical protein
MLSEFEVDPMVLVLATVLAMVLAMVLVIAQKFDTFAFEQVVVVMEVLVVMRGHPKWTFFSAYFACF